MHTPRRALLSRWARLLRLQALVALLGVLPALAASAERLQVAHSTLTATNTVLWVARDKGIFQGHGLDVRLIYVAGVRSLQALLANEVEIVSVAGSTAIQANLDITKIAIPSLEDLATRSGETSQLYLLQGHQVVCAEAVTSPNMIRFMPERGRGLPLHAPAAGRAVLAFLPGEFLTRYIKHPGLRAMTPYTVTDPQALQRLLAKIRAQCFAVSFQQMYVGARGVAVPIFDHRGGVLGSLCISGPDPRFSEDAADALAPLLQKHARALSAALGGPADGSPESEGN